MNFNEMIELAKLVAKFRNDPLGFVLHCYPWDKGELAGFTGPDANQREFLESFGEEIRKRDFDGKNPVMPIRMAETSGHGTGKSAMGAWIGNFLMSTRPWSIGTVTAGTATQLIQRTFAAFRKWTKLCITADWWEIRKMAIYIKKELCGPNESPENWKVVDVVPGLQSLLSSECEHTGHRKRVLQLPIPVQPRGRANAGGVSLWPRGQLHAGFGGAHGQRGRHAGGSRNDLCHHSCGRLLAARSDPDADAGQRGHRDHGLPPRRSPWR